MKTLVLCCLLALGIDARAQIPVTDIANLASNQLAHIENIAKWVQSIAQLKMQIEQMKQQISIQSDLRQWSGNPLNAVVGLNALGEGDLIRNYGQSQKALLNVKDSLASLKNTGSDTYRAITDRDLDGGEVKFGEKTFRRYAVLDAKQADAASVAEQTAGRHRELQRDIAATLAALRSARTDSEVQKNSAKLAALNGQLAQVEAERKRRVDEVALQKIANDARLEQERQAAAELEAKDAYLAQQRISAYMQTLRLRKPTP